MEGVGLPTSWPLAVQGRAARRPTVRGELQQQQQDDNLRGATAHGVQVCDLRERERKKREREGEVEGQRDRGSEEKACHTVLVSPLTNSVPFFPTLIATQPLNCTHPPTCLCHGCQLARVLHASVVSAACVLVPRVSEREREKLWKEEVIIPPATTPGRSNRGT